MSFIKRHSLTVTLSLLAHAIPILLFLTVPGDRSPNQPIELNGVLEPTHPRNSLAHTIAASKASIGAISSPPAGSETGTLSVLVPESYLEGIKAKILEHQKYPLEARKRHLEGVMEYEIEVSKSGEIHSISLISEAKTAILEQAGREAIEASSPFLHPPAGKSCKIRIPIEFKIK